MNIERRIKSCAPLACLLALALALAAGGQTATSTPGLEWERLSDSLALKQGGQIVWRFNFGTNESKPGFHPLAVAGGPTLSCYRPKDHPWHRGLWFSWKYINKVNYWEESRKTGLPDGITDWRAPVVETQP